MPHESTHIIHQSLLEIFTDEEEYPGVREHFSEHQLARLDSFKSLTEFNLSDKIFLWRMLGKLLFTAD